MSSTSRQTHAAADQSPYPPASVLLEPGHHDFVSTATAALLSTSPAVSPSVQQYRPQTITRQPARKRKPAIPGSRGVSTLTHEQLVKKRANDREAQRAIRERTKNNTAVLQQRIRDLETQQPHQELQRALAERDKALADCEELRQRLAAVAGIVGSRNIGQTGLSELAALTAQQPPMPAGNAAEHEYRQATGAGADDPEPSAIRAGTSSDLSTQLDLEPQHLDPELSNSHDMGMSNAA